MAISFEIRIGDLLPELPTDALILLSSLKSAGTIASRALETFPDGLHHFFIFVEPYCHTTTSFRIYYTAIIVPVNLPVQNCRIMSKNSSAQIIVIRFMIWYSRIYIVKGGRLWRSY